MKVIDYRVIESDNAYEVGLRNKCVLIETLEEKSLNAQYIQQGCNSGTPIGQAWNEMLAVRTGLTDEDVFFFFDSPEQAKDEWELDGIKMVKEDKLTNN